MALVALGRRRARTAPPALVKVVDAATEEAAAGLRDGEPIDLNSAPASALELLPRIGPALAARIVEARPFSRVEEVTRVRGIGPRTLERLRPLVTVTTAE